MSIPPHTMSFNGHPYIAPYPQIATHFCNNCGEPVYHNHKCWQVTIGNLKVENAALKAEIERLKEEYVWTKGDNEGP